MTTLAKIFPVDPVLMPVEVFVGGNGDIVLLQEVPSLQFGERYLRVMVRPDQAKALCMAITNAARAARKAGKP